MIIMVDQFLPIFKSFLPAAVILLFILAALKILSVLAARRQRDADYKRTLIPQLLMVVTSLCGLLFVVVALPVSDTTRGQILGLLGVVFTGIFALSSTTFVTNALAGLMLRLIKNYKSGDFIRVHDNFGRITERGLFHTEIQTEERNLTTFPNLYLVTNPMTVLRSSGTIISASLSLGYDTPHQVAEQHLLEAAGQSGLTEPFVQIVELGNFSITYKVSGFLSDTKQLLAARSNLKRCVLAVLHQVGVEIVSPAFMNQRVLPGNVPVIPEPPLSMPSTADKGALLPEDVIFDKAETAEQLAHWKERLGELNAKLNSLGKKKGADSSHVRARIEAAIAKIEKRIETIDQVLSEDNNLKEA